VPARDQSAQRQRQEELIGLIDGVREMRTSWKGILLDLKQRDLRWGRNKAKPSERSEHWMAETRNDARGAFDTFAESTDKVRHGGRMV